jgi:hypothetical protein
MTSDPLRTRSDRRPLRWRDIMQNAKGADLRPKMKGVVASFESELNKRRTKSVKPPV